MDHRGRVIEAQVDWLTVSAHGEQAARNMLDLAQGLAKEEESKGNRRRMFRLMGYEGHHIGSVEYGQRDGQSTLLRLIGDSADRHLTVALSLADQVTRVDLATTWRAEPPNAHLGRNTYALASDFLAANPRAALPQRIHDARGGETVYIGSRQSQHFFRLYNKEAECAANDDWEGTRRYKDAWRYELEIKGPLAASLAATVDERQDRPAYVRDYVWQYLDAHGIVPPFAQGERVDPIPGFRRRSDADSKLRHLARNVRPTADWLRAAGEEENLRRVLGFDRSAELLMELQGILYRHSVRVEKSPTEMGGERGVESDGEPT